jgi:predicted N-acetyltransferase YhbS
MLSGPDLDAIATLVARSCVDPPTRAELEKALTERDQPATVVGDPGAGVVATVTREGDGFVRLLAVAPERRGRGLGRRLLAMGEETLQAGGATSVTVGADAPYYLWPGVDTRELAAICLLERMHYQRVETNVNMDVDLRALPDDPGAWSVAGPAERGAVDEWATRHWPWWRAEMLRAVDQAGLVVTTDAHGIAAVCAHDVNRAGLVGPVAVRPELLGRGVGTSALLGALHRMRVQGRDRAEIAWVGPIVPYARIGATLGRTFFVYRKALA